MIVSYRKLFIYSLAGQHHQRAVNSVGRPAVNELRPSRGISQKESFDQTLRTCLGIQNRNSRHPLNHLYFPLLVHKERWAYMNAINLSLLTVFCIPILLCSFVFATCANWRARISTRNNSLTSHFSSRGAKAKFLCAARQCKMIYWIVTNRWAEKAKPLINPIAARGEGREGWGCCEINHNIGETMSLEDLRNETNGAMIFWLVLS